MPFDFLRLGFVWILTVAAFVSILGLVTGVRAHHHHLPLRGFSAASAKSLSISAGLLALAWEILQS